MDENVPDGTMSKCDIDDTNLPAVMASLEMLTVDANVSSTSSNRRKLRKRIPKAVPSEILNRRCSRKPKKRTLNLDNEEDIREYYLDKSIKTQPNNLETIFEEKDETKETSVHMSVKRYKRMIQFQPQPTDSKLRKRRAKIKKLFGSQINFKRKRGSIQMLLDKLKHIQTDTQATTEVQ